jgi:superfamily I DNA/RNA helicase
LGEVLREQFRMHDLVTAGSFHAVCRGFADRAGMLPDGPVDDEWWEQALPASLPDSAWKLGIQFDAIIVDEAQDFHPDWWMYLEMLFSERTDSIMSVFADSNQDIYRVGWAPPFLTDPFPLDVNCRNTVEIASRVSAVLGSNQPTLGVHGVEPLMFEVSTPRQSEKALERILTRLINDELLDPAQIAVLSTSRDEIEKLRGAEIAGTVLGDEPGDRSVLIETVHRFKGLEANVVILLLHDGEEQDVKRLAYVGMSRARALLVLIASKAMFDVIRWA